MVVTVDTTHGCYNRSADDQDQPKRSPFRNRKDRAAAHAFPKRLAVNQLCGGQVFTGAVDLSLLEPPVNILRLSLHPNGFTLQIINYSEWRKYLLEYLNRQIEITANATSNHFDEFLER